MGKTTKKIVDNQDKVHSNANNSAPASGGEQEEKQQVKRSSTESKLCQGKFYEECPSSALTDTFYTAVVTGMDFWEVKETSLNGGKDFSKGRVELQIRDRCDLTDFAEIAYQAKELIAQQLEISPAQLSQIENGRYPHPLKPYLKGRIVEYLSLDKRLD